MPVRLRSPCARRQRLRALHCASGGCAHRPRRARLGCVRGEKFVLCFLPRPASDPCCGDCRRRWSCCRQRVLRVARWVFPIHVLPFSVGIHAAGQRRVSDAAAHATHQSQVVLVARLHRVSKFGVWFVAQTHVRSVHSCEGTGQEPRYVRVLFPAPFETGAQLPARPAGCSHRLTGRQRHDSAVDVRVSARPTRSHSGGRLWYLRLVLQIAVPPADTRSSQALT